MNAAGNFATRLHIVESNWRDQTACLFPHTKTGAEHS